MSTFDELAVRNGVGVVYYFDVTLDASVAATLRYSTAYWDNWTTLEPSPRLTAVGNLSRELAETRALSSSTIAITLENSDGGVDWLADQSTFLTQAIKSEWTLTCRLYNPLDATDYATKTLGVFTLMDPPTRTNGTIEVTLSDQLLNRFDMDTPTIEDWCNITDADRPFTMAQLENPSRAPAAYKPTAQPSVTPFDPYTPLPLAWGLGSIELTYITTSVFVACVVPGSAGALPTGLLPGGGVFTSGGVPIPSSVQVLPGPPPTRSTTIVEFFRTPTITKNGKDWHILWCRIDLRGDAEASDSLRIEHTFNVAMHFAAYGKNLSFLGVDYLGNTYSVTPDGWPELIAQYVDSVNYYQFALEAGPFIVKDAELLSHNVDDLGPANEITAATVVEDILTQCINVPLSSVDGVAATNSLRPVPVIKKLYRSSTSYDNGSWKELATGETVSELRKLCDVGNFDLYFKWDGTAALNALGADYASQSATLAALDETLIESITERIPGAGERNAPINRIYVSNGGQIYGPLNNSAAVTAWGRISSKTIDGSWMPSSGGNLAISPNSFRSTDPVLADYIRREVAPRAEDVSIARPTLSVVTGLNGLTFDLCDYITFTWTRGTIGGPYIDSVFRVEGISLSPLDGKTQLKLVWCDDLRAADNLPYILDDETQYLRLAASGGRTMTLTDGSTTVVCSSGNLGSDGVLVGDILVVADATEAATAFKRNRTLRILGVTATTLTVDVSDFGSGGPFVLTTWGVQKGATTSSRAIYYGKTCDGNGQFSDSSDANRILEG